MSEIHIHKKKIDIANSHELILDNHDWRVVGDRDTDTYCYDEINENGELVHKHTIRYETSKYAPFESTFLHQKIKA